MFLEFSLEARSYWGLELLGEVIHGYVPVSGLNHAGQLYPPTSHIENQETGILDYMLVFYELGWHYLAHESQTKQALLKN